MEAVMTSGDLIRQTRHALDKTQKWLATSAGVSERTVMRAENDEKILSESMMAICAVLGLDSSRMPRREPAEKACDDPDDRNADPATRTAPERRRGRRHVVGHAFGMLAVILCSAMVGAWIPYPSASEMGRNTTTLFDLSLSRTLRSKLNGIALAVAEGRDSDIDLQAGRLRWRGSGMDCRTYDSCVVRPNGNDVERRVDGSYVVTLGPLSPLLYQTLIHTFMSDPRVEMLGTITETATPSVAGDLWFDPRGVAKRRLPSLASGQYLHVRVSRK